MQIKMTRDQALQHIRDVSTSLARDDGETVVIELPDAWTTETPTEPGWYWTDYCYGTHITKLTNCYGGRIYAPDGDLFADEMTDAHWIGPLPTPEPPELPPGAVHVAGAIFDDD